VASQPFRLSGLQTPLIALAISPDSHWLVTTNGRVFGNTGSARLWDLTTKSPTDRWFELPGHKVPVNQVAFSRDSRWLVTASGFHNSHTGAHDSTPHLWDLKAMNPTAKPIPLPGHKWGITAIAFSPDYRFLVTGGGESLLGLGGSDSTARLWDLTSKDPAAGPIVLPTHDRSVTFVAIGAEQKWLVSVAGTCQLWELSAKDSPPKPVVLSDRGIALPIFAVALSPDSRWLATLTGNTARVWDLTSKAPTARPRVLRGHDRPITTVAFSPDSGWLATGSEDKTLRLWSLAAAEPNANPIVLPSEMDERFVISADGHWSMTIVEEGAPGRSRHDAYLWDLTAPIPAATPRVTRDQFLASR
jgi:WD40 repeat protein